MFFTSSNVVASGLSNTFFISIPLNPCTGQQFLKLFLLNWCLNFRTWYVLRSLLPPCYNLFKCANTLNKLRKGVFVVDTALKDKIANAAKCVLSFASDERGQKAFTSKQAEIIGKAIAAAIEAYEKNK